MGRELRRVPLDFDWPLNKRWRGYLNPHRKECPEAIKNNCHGGGTSAAKWLEAVCHLLALMGEEATANTPEHRAHFAKTGRVYPHPYLQEWGQAPQTSIPRDVSLWLRDLPREQKWAELNRYVRQHPHRLLDLDDEMVQLVQGLAPGRDLADPSGCGISRSLYRTLLKAAGLNEDEWGICKVCGGEGIDLACKEAYENWRREDPPEGEGWQLWETTSEGSPISPVFATQEEFVQYLIGQGYSEKAARKFCATGWVPSLVMLGDGTQFKDIEVGDIDP